MLGVLPFVEDPDLSVSAACTLAQLVPPCPDIPGSNKNHHYSRANRFIFPQCKMDLSKSLGRLGEFHQSRDSQSQSQRGNYRKYCRPDNRHSSFVFPVFFSDLYFESQHFFSWSSSSFLTSNWPSGWISSQVPAEFLSKRFFWKSIQILASLLQDCSLEFSCFAPSLQLKNIFRCDSISRILPLKVEIWTHLI